MICGDVMRQKIDENRRAGFFKVTVIYFSSATEMIELNLPDMYSGTHLIIIVFIVNERRSEG